MDGDTVSNISLGIREWHQGKHMRPESNIRSMMGCSNIRIEVWWVVLAHYLYTIWDFHASIYRGNAQQNGHILFGNPTMTGRPTPVANGVLSKGTITGSDVKGYDGLKLVICLRLHIYIAFSCLMIRNINRSRRNV